MRRAFTVLEMVTALALSGIVALAAFSLIGMLGRTDGVTSHAVDTATRMAITHSAITRALERLVAATPIPQEVADRMQGEDGETLQDENAETPPEVDAAGVTPGLSGDLPVEVAVADTSGPPHFDLHFVSTPHGPVPRLEVVLETPPIGRQQAGIPTADQRLSMLRAEWLGSVRGAFELTPTGAGWALIWSPIDPPGDPVLLIDGLVQCSWEALTRGEKGWQPLHSAYLQPDFPIAVRLLITTSAGDEADWLFETAVITEGR